MNEQEQLFSELQDELKRDNLKKLWEQYGHLLIGFCVAIVIATGIGVAWKSYQRSQDETYTGQLMVALKETGPKQQEALEALAKSAGHRPQASLAELYLGAADLAADKSKEALSHYEAAAASGDAELANLGRVMATHVATSYNLPLPEDMIVPKGGAFYNAGREADGWHDYSAGKQTDAILQFNVVADDASASNAQRERMRSVTSYLTPAAADAGK